MPFNAASDAGRPRIDLNQRFAAEYWTQEFGCTLAALQTAVAATDGSVAAVTTYLKASALPRSSNWWEVPSFIACRLQQAPVDPDPPIMVPADETTALNAQLSGQLLRLDQRMISLEKELATARLQVAQMPVKHRPLGDSLIALVEHTLAMTITARLEVLDMLWK